MCHISKYPFKIVCPRRLGIYFFFVCCCSPYPFRNEFIFSFGGIGIGGLLTENDYVIERIQFSSTNNNRFVGCGNRIYLSHAIQHVKRGGWTKKRKKNNISISSSYILYNKSRRQLYYIILAKSDVFLDYPKNYKM